MRCSCGAIGDRYRGTVVPERTCCAILAFRGSPLGRGASLHLLESLPSHALSDHPERGGLAMFPHFATSGRSSFGAARAEQFVTLVEQPVAKGLPYLVPAAAQRRLQVLVVDDRQNHCSPSSHAARRSGSSINRVRSVYRRDCALPVHASRGASADAAAGDASGRLLHLKPTRTAPVQEALVEKTHKERSERHCGERVHASAHVHRSDHCSASPGGIRSQTAASGGARKNSA
jgi:hypothetical protein